MLWSTALIPGCVFFGRHDRSLALVAACVSYFVNSLITLEVLVTLKSKELREIFCSHSVKSVFISATPSTVKSRCTIEPVGFWESRLFCGCNGSLVLLQSEFAESAPLPGASDVSHSLPQLISKSLLKSLPLYILGSLAFFHLICKAPILVKASSANLLLYAGE